VLVGVWEDIFWAMHLVPDRKVSLDIEPDSLNVLRWHEPASLQDAQGVSDAEDQGPSDQEGEGR
jgi:hypothetical protein